MVIMMPVTMATGHDAISMPIADNDNDETFVALSSKMVLKSDMFQDQAHRNTNGQSRNQPSGMSQHEWF
jgi:hypothetical protein